MTTVNTNHMTRSQSRGASAAPANYCLVTVFETWVSRDEWYRYAIANPADIPHLLVDRSQCTDPFLDQFTAIESARPILSGICRRRTRYPIGGQIIYVSRVDRRVLSDLGRSGEAHSESAYFLVAALSIQHVHATHHEASQTFVPGRYGPKPLHAPFPPNLVHLPYPGAGLARESCITHDVSKKPPKPHTPQTSTSQMHRRHYAAYRTREPGLPVAECRFINGIRFLNPSTAPILSRDSWGGAVMGRRGLRLTRPTFDGLLKIAAAAQQAAAADAATRRG